MNNVPVITVDGPSGVGKGTLSLSLAKQLGWNFLDSGVIYRALALYAEQKSISLESEDALSELAIELPLSFIQDSSKLQIILEEKDISETVRLETTGNKASIIAKFEKVRANLLERQRGFAVEPGLVADGRDMGTVVFPNAKLKIFLTASSQVRAKRRYKQLLENGNCVKIEQVLYEVEERDKRDISRKASPLLPAEGALIIDTSDLKIADVEKRVREAVENIRF